MRLSHLCLDGRQLPIPVNDVIAPGYQKRVPNEGMPTNAGPDARGDLVCFDADEDDADDADEYDDADEDDDADDAALMFACPQIIRFNIVFPTNLSEKKKALVREALA